MKVKIVGIQAQDYTLDNGYSFKGFKLHCLDLESKPDGLTGELVMNIKIPYDSPLASIPLAVGHIPSFCPIQGGAWCDVETVEGRACFVVPDNYRIGVFGFQGVSGYNIANVTNATVSGYIYFESPTSWYTNPQQLQCRFSNFGTLQVYAPYYYTGSSSTRYQWETLEIQSINNTNIALMDEAGDRQNNLYLYSTSEKLLIFVCCLLIGLILLFVLRSAWRA